MSFHHHAVITLERHQGGIVVPITKITVGTEEKIKTISTPAEVMTKYEWEKFRLAADDFFYGGAFRVGFEP